MINIESLKSTRTKSDHQTIHFCYGTGTTPFGTLFCAHTEMGISSLEFETDTRDYQRWVSKLKQNHPNATFTENTKSCQEAINQALRFGTQQPTQSITLNIDASPFQIKVWQKLLDIEFGQLSSYQRIAEQIGQPKASRAVGNAVARNPIALLIPCHRVIQSNGGWGQYRWGADRKRAIHEWERIQLQQSIHSSATSQPINGL